ncbi:MAG TPA: hypothetical protein ENI27_06635 [bacterium]|nr:hypothetical protein [bacterium]
MNRRWIILATTLLITFIVCCICLFIVALSATLWSFSSSPTIDDPPLWLSTPLSTPVVIRPTFQATRIAQTTPGVLSTPIIYADDLQETLKTLSDTVIPINDVPDLARRLEGKENIPPTMDPPAFSLQIGRQETFWVSNTDTNENFQVQATLRYVTDHAYFWIQDDVPYYPEDLVDLAETFENKIYPTNREFFGSEWTPGVDGDVHLYILYARGLGNGIAGYFSSTDGYNPLIQEYSNAHEMFMINADSVALDEEFTFGVLAHEFQHMIHWYRDRNEATWMNEGFSDLAMFLNGYSIGGHDNLYTRNPDLQLNDWPTDSDETGPHYGASFLFMTYFLDRFGEDATKALVADLSNGMDSIDKLLREMGATDPMTGETIGADNVFADWVVASYLKDPTVADGRYTYHNYPSAPQASATERIRSCGSEMITRDVHQYGVDYIQITCKNYTLHFEGSLLVSLLPIDPYSGSYAFWSNKGDESDMTLTQTFDFTDQSGPLTLNYWTWYDIEEDFDYLYLEASQDGENWQILTTPSGTADDPTGANYGWGYNGVSQSGSGDGSSPQWIQESVDISQFAGHQVQLRFEYITDAAVNGEGFLLDDVAIPQISYFTDFENDNGGWEAAGFARIQNILPQNFRLALITYGQETTVQYLSLSADNVVDIPLNFAGDVVLVVTGTTRFTRQPATYRFNFTP